MLEHELQSKCMKWLRESHPEIVFANIHGGGWSAKGFPDLICCIGGRFVAFELKVGKNGMQADQRIWKKRIERAGGRHYCPRTTDDFRRYVQAEIALSAAMPGQDLVLQA